MTLRLKKPLKISPMLNQYLALLVDSGRKFVTARPGMKPENILTDLECQELAGYMLMEISDTPEIFNFYRFYKQDKPGLGVHFISRLCTYCIEDSVYNGERLLDDMKIMVRYYFQEDNRMQGLLDWFRHGQQAQYHEARQRVIEGDHEVAHAEELRYV